MRLRFPSIICLFLLTLISGACSAEAPANPVLAKEPLFIDSLSGTHNFQVEMAVTPEEQSRGLMFRMDIGAEEGMLFPFDRSRQASFWMKNTFISLDMLFIARDGTIANIAAQTKPQTLESYTSGRRRVKAVLEIRGGLAKELGIKAGDTVHHKVFGNLPFCNGESSQKPCNTASADSKE